MDTVEQATRVGLPIYLTGFALAGVALPLLRLRARSGIWGLVVHRGGPRLQRAVGAAAAAQLFALVAWVALYSALGPGPLRVARVGGPAPAAVGWALLALGLAPLVVAQAQMGGAWRIGIDDRPTALVTGGLYRVVRNPIYSGLLLAVAGVVVLTPSPWSALIGAGITAAVAVQTRLEERHLAALHGGAYRDYAARVGRFLPGVGRLT